MWSAGQLLQPFLECRLDRLVVLDALADHRRILDLDHPAGVEPGAPKTPLPLALHTRVRGCRGCLFPGFLSQYRRAGKRGE